MLDFNLPYLAQEADLPTPLLDIADIAVPLTLLACACVLVVATRRQVHSPFDWRPCWLFGGFALAYFAALNIASTGGSSDNFQGRYVAPLCIPLLMVATFALDWLFGRASANKRMQALPKVLIGTLGIVLALWVAGQAMHNVREVRRENSFAENTRDLSAPRWLGSDTLRHVRENPLNGVVFSNQHDVVYFNNDGQSKYWWLRADDRPGDLTFAYENALISDAEDGTYLVWFRGWDSHIYPFGETQMRIHPGLVPVASLADGAIFKIERDHVPPNPYRQAHRIISAGKLGNPAVRSTFDVYRAGRTLTYVKQPCLPEDTRARFFLHFTVASPGTANEDRVIGKNFDFWEAGTMLEGDLCVLIAELPPSLPIIHMRTGQVGDRNSWSAEPHTVGLDVHGTSPSSASD